MKTLLLITLLCSILFLSPGCVGLFGVGSGEESVEVVNETPIVVDETAIATPPGVSGKVIIYGIIGEPYKISPIAGSIKDSIYQYKICIQGLDTTSFIEVRGNPDPENFVYVWENLEVRGVSTSGCIFLRDMRRIDNYIGMVVVF